MSVARADLHGNTGGPIYYRNADACAQAIIEWVGKEIVFAMPLALGKPITLVNALYRAAKADPSIRLTIYGSLHLEPPLLSSELEHRLLDPFFERMWGDIPRFEYMEDLRKGTAPADRVEVVQGFCRAGSIRGDSSQQQSYICTNYTHSIRDGTNIGGNVVSQIVAERMVDGRKIYSMSCNADTHQQAAREFREMARRGDPKRRCVTAEVNRNLPFLWGNSCVSPDWYDIVLDDPNYSFPLFHTPKEAVNTTDYMLGLYDSMLVADGGTIQIGIGALGDATAYALRLRHLENEQYRRALDSIGALQRYRDLIRDFGGVGTFDEGVLASSEMFVDAFLPLVQAGVVKRRVYEHEGLQRMLNEGRVQENFGRDILDVLIENGVMQPFLGEDEFATLQRFGVFRDDVSWKKGRLLRGGEIFSADLSDRANLERVKGSCLGSGLRDGAFLYAAFFLGTAEFYQGLRDLPEEVRRGIRMEGVEFVNQLYGDEGLKRAQRVKGRFMNTGLVATLGGSVASDTTENYQVMSGPGGQYNFVAMAHALTDGRSILNVRSCRQLGKQTLSNILWEYPGCTIPRHLRDIIVSEYGIADIRGKRDRDVMTAMIEIADSRFQPELIRKAKESGKIPRGYVVPDHARQNCPERLVEELKPLRETARFPPFPFGGAGLTPAELVLGVALKTMKEKMVMQRATALKAIAMAALKGHPAGAKPYLERMGLDAPKNRAEKMMANVVVAGLTLTKVI